MAVIEATYRSSSEHRAVAIEEIMGDRYDPGYGAGYTHGFREWTPPLSDTGDEGVLG
jgi:hypothetical protein